MEYISKEEGDLIYLVLQNRFAREVLTYIEKYHLLKAAIFLDGLDVTDFAYKMNGNAVKKCQYCGHREARKTECKKCGAPAE